MRALVVCALASCAHPAAPVTRAPSAPCLCERRGSVQRTDLNELSGLAASERHDGILWAVKDSGEPRLRLYALDEQGALHGTFEVPDTSPIDVEDVTLWRRPHGPRDTLLLADIGDNLARDGGRGRADIVVYAVDEPTPGNRDATEPVTARFALRLRYPDHAHDAEALFVDPVSQALYVFTKETLGPARVYRAPAPLQGGERTLEEVARLSVGTERVPGLMITAAAISTGGEWIAVRTYGSLLTFSRAPGQPVELALQGRAQVLPLPAERQGEAVTFAAHGGGVYTVSEGTAPDMHYTPLQCALVRREGDPS